jgi:hypothetical protein
MWTFNQGLGHVVRKPIASKTPVWKVMALGAGIGLAMLSYPVHAAPASGGALS